MTAREDAPAKMVPREPTQEMIEAGITLAGKRGQLRYRQSRTTLGEAFAADWRAMFDAAPPPPAAPQPDAGLVERLRDLMCRLSYESDIAPLREAAAALAARDAEVARLTQLCNDSLMVQGAARDAAHAQWERAERAEAERDAALADARRYRWLRDEGIEWLPPKYDGRDYGRFDMFYKWPDANLDAAIDVALAAQATGAQEQG